MSFEYTMMTYNIARQQGEEVDLEGIFRFARELELNSVDQVTLYGMKPTEIRKMADDYGLQIVCYTFFVDLNFPNAKDRAPGLDLFKRELENTRILGATKIMLPFDGKAEFTREQSRSNIIAALPEVVQLGKAAQIDVTIEHVPSWNGPFIISSDVNEAIEAAPGLKVTYDPGNAVTGGEDPIDTFLNSKDSIIHTHFKDWLCPSNDHFRLTGLDGKRYLPTFIGRGILDYPAIMKTMKEHGYANTINVEYEGDDYPARSVLREAFAYLRKIEASL